MPQPVPFETNGTDAGGFQAHSTVLAAGGVTEDELVNEFKQARRNRRKART